jgi:uncharacterized repeat protein (TIGR03803 family)
MGAPPWPRRSRPCCIVSSAAPATGSIDPLAGLIADEQGALYGTTAFGGNGNCVPNGCGTVFKLTPPGKGQSAWTETVLHSFQGSSSSDGFLPEAGVIIDKEGALYGTRFVGGSNNCEPDGCGTVFKLTPPTKGQKTWTETVLHSFQGGNDGYFSYAGLIADKRGALYGTTFGGGRLYGTVFKLTPPAPGQNTWTETVLHSFTGSDGAFPYAGLIADKFGAAELHYRAFSLLLREIADALTLVLEGSW